MIVKNKYLKFKKNIKDYTKYEYFNSFKKELLLEF